MGKFKENLKKHWKNLLIICVVAFIAIGAVVGIVVNRLNSEEAVSQVYTVEVKDENGKSIEEVYLMLYAEDGTEISWLPSVTNITGEARFSQGVGEGCYIKVVGVPIGYALDGSVKYTFDENGKITIVLGEDDSVYTARIGDIKYISLATALSVANTSSEDVVVEMLADSTLKTFTIKNNYGKTITINGNGHTLTAEGGNNTFVINQTEGTVAFENMTIKHKNTGAVVQANGLVTVNMTDVMIDATEGTAYNYALINTLAVDGTTTLNLTRVDAKMAVGSPSKDDYAGIIRTGNQSGTKNVEINLVDCNFDTEGATGRHGIVVMKNTVANITATNSTFKAGDGYAIWAVEQTKEQTLTMNSSQAVSTLDPFSATPIKGYFAQIGNTYYLPLSAATKVANASKKDITLKLITDVTIKTCEINNKYGRLVTLDGNGKTVTTEKGNNAFVVGNNVVFKNMTINHKNTGSAIHVTTAGTVTATDVFIKATEGENYTYTLVNTLAEGATTLNFTRVKAVMAVETEGKSNPSIIRTGNSGVKKTVVMNLTDCELDTTKATGRSGITITDDAATTVNLKNTTIKTMDTFAIRSNEQDINWNNADTTLTSLTEYYQVYPVEGYLTKIGDVFYTFAQAVDVANAATTDTTIKVLTDYTIKTYTINNTNGKLVTVDGDDKKITTKSGNNAFVVGNRVAFKNMTIEHTNSGSVIQATEIGTIDVANVTINATKPGSDGYKYTLFNLAAEGDTTTLNMNGVNVTMAVAGRGKDGNSAIIRTGNGSSSEDAERGTKTVAINLTNCNFDTTAATGRSGIVVMNTTTANINLNNTTMKTLDAAPIKSSAKTAISQTLVLNNATLGSVTKEFNDEPIRGYEAQIGNTVYRNMQDALKEANKSTEDVTVKVVYDFDRGVTFSINNANGKAVTIDGDGHTVTTSGGSGNNSFVIGTAQTGAVEIKNMDIVHKNRGSVVQIASKDESKVNVKVTDVNIDATNPTNTVTSGGKTYTNIYSYALINMTVSSTLELNNVDVDMDVMTAGIGSTKEWAIIRTGNGSSASEPDRGTKTVDMKLVDCNLDATGAVDRYGILIMDTTDATIDMQNTNIRTMNVNAIKECNPTTGQATISEDSDFVCGKKADEHTGYAIQVGNTWYVEYGTALLEAAKTSEEDITITLSKDTTIDLSGLKNENGKTITIDTNGYSLTTTGTKDDTVTIVSESYVTVGAETIYADLEGAVEKANSASQDARIELLAASEVNLTNINNTNGKKITIDTNGKILATTGTLWSNVSIVSQSKYESGNQTLYVKLTDALAKAKESNNDVVITITSNVTVKKETKIENANGKSITIDGNGCTVTTEQKAFMVNYKGHVSFENMRIEHTATQAAIQIASVATVDITDVIINVPDTVKNYQFGLINITATTSGEEEIDISLTNVDVIAAMTTKQTNAAQTAILRTEGGTQKVNITLEDCEWTVTNGVDVSGILIRSGNTATINMVDSSIAINATTTKNTACPIYDYTGTVVINKKNCSMSVQKENVVAQVGNTLYTNFTDADADATNDALSVANATGKAIELLANIEVEQNIYVGNTNGITIDGNNYKITTAGGANNHAFNVNQAGIVVFKNMTMEHKNYGYMIQVTAAGATLELKDMTVDAKYAEDNDKDTYQYGLINLATNSTLNMADVNVDMDAANNGYGSTAQWAIIRTGNKDNNADKEVTINLTGCVLDASGAVKRNGILLVDAKATVTLQDTDIFTAEDIPVIRSWNPSLVSTINVGNKCELKSGNNSVDVTDATKMKTIMELHNNSSVVPFTEVDVASASLSLEEESDTKTLILEVPAQLYDALVDWIKQFATKNGWNLAL